MEAITGDITREQVLSHRSSLVDRKMLSEQNYENMNLVEWNGYLLVSIDNKIYLADSNQKVQNNGHFEYEWFYWEFNHNITCINENNGILYLCEEMSEEIDENGYIKYVNINNDIYWYDLNNNKLYDNNYEEVEIPLSDLEMVESSKVYTLTNNMEEREIHSYWTTKLSDCDYPQMLKTTNKKGFKCDVFGNKIIISSKTDNNEFEQLGEYENTKGYIVAKLKKKKWNKIQLKFESSKPFGIYEITMEVYIGSYVKRS